MDYNQFINTICKNIIEYLPAEYKNAQVTIDEITKNNNVKLKGLCIRLPDTILTPTIYLEGYFKEYENGIDLEIILRKIAEIRINNATIAEVKPTDFLSFKKIKNRILPKLINAEMNADFLKDKPHRLVENLAIVYYISFDNLSDTQLSTVINYKLFDNYGISLDDLHNTAIANISQCTSFGSMYSFLSKAYPEADTIRLKDSDSIMFILTCNHMSNGAAAVLSHETMDYVAEQIGTDFFILPSSINELIIVKQAKDTDISALSDMVKEINQTQLDKIDVLSNDVYVYDYDEHTIRIAA